jgi:PDZ domain
VRAALSAAVLLLSPLPLIAQARDSSSTCSCSIGRSHKPNVFYFGKARGEGPVIGVETSSGSVRDTLGVLVVGVTNNGPADKAGIEEGDRIASANGIDLRLNAADAADREMHGLMSRRLARAVQKAKVGDAIELRVYHDGQYKTVKLTTVKASDLALDDDAMFGGDIQIMPEIRAGRMLDDMHLDMPSTDEFQKIKMQMPDLRRSFEKLKTMKAAPFVIYDDGIHRI